MALPSMGQKPTKRLIRWSLERGYVVIRIELRHLVSLILGGKVNLESGEGLGTLSSSLVFSRRELQVFDLVREGLSNKEIADRLRISIGTVKFHVGALLKKSGFHSRFDLIRLMRKYAIVALAILLLCLASLAGTKKLVLLTKTLPSAKQGMPYSVTLQASGGTPPYHWMLTSGNLPAGLTLSSTGVISGTPTTPGTANFTVRVTDSGRTPAAAERSF